MGDGLTDGPIRADGDVLRRHEPAGAVFGITQQRPGFGPFGRAEQVQQALPVPLGQLLQEGGPVVRTETRQKGPGFLVGQLFQEGVPGAPLEEREDFGRDSLGERAEQDRPGRFGQIGQEIGQFGHRPGFRQRPEGVPVPLFDQLFNFRFANVDHGDPFPSVFRSAHVPPPSSE